MMSVFKVFLDDLPPFQTYWKKFFDKKQMSVVNKSTGMKVAHIAKARKELWHPVSKTNNECTPRMLELVEVAFKRWKVEMLDKKKATLFNLSVSRDKG